MWCGHYCTIAGSSSSEGCNSCMNMISYRIVFSKKIIIVCRYEARLTFELPIRIKEVWAPTTFLRSARC